jgi:hypothetical protein
LAADARWDQFVADLHKRGRASASIEAWVRLPDGNPAAQCPARYVAFAKG